MIAVKLYELGVSDYRFDENTHDPTESGRKLRLEEDPLFRCPSALSDALKQTLKNVADPSYQPSGSDYLTITQLEKQRIRFSNSDEYSKLKNEALKLASTVSNEDIRSMLRGDYSWISRRFEQQDKAQIFRDFCAKLQK